MPRHPPRPPGTPVVHPRDLTRLPRRTTRTQLFHIRASFRGMIYWTCPWCGAFNASHLLPESYISVRIECTSAGCQASFLLGLTFTPSPTGPPRQPADANPPTGTQLIDTFPRGELVDYPWAWGERVHRLTRDAREKELEVVERYFERVEKRIDDGKTDIDAFRTACEKELDSMRVIAENTSVRK